MKSVGHPYVKCHRFSSTISEWAAWLVCRRLWRKWPIDLIEAQAQNMLLRTTLF
jgi:hypothetical protein